VAIIPDNFFLQFYDVAEVAITIGRFCQIWLQAKSGMKIIKHPSIFLANFLNHHA